MTDSSTALKATTMGRWQHDTVNHTQGEYVRYEGGVCVTTNTVESYFNILKRGINGLYHHVSRQHLHRLSGGVRLPLQCPECQRY